MEEPSRPEYSLYKCAGKSVSKTIRKLGILVKLLKRLNTDRDGVIVWTNEHACLEILKYKMKRKINHTCPSLTKVS